MFSVDRRAAAAAAALVLAATASLGAVTGANAETGGTGKADAAFDKTLGQLIREPGGPPGAIAVVQRGNHMKVFRKGVADQKTGAPIDVGDSWRIGSVSKAFNGAVALQLVAQGKLSLSDTIGQRLPAVPPAWHNVTLGQLLNHTSGLPNFTKDPGWQRAVQEGEYLSPMDLIGLVSAQPPRVPARRELRVLEHRQHRGGAVRRDGDRAALRHTALPAGLRSAAPAPYRHAAWVQHAGAVRPRLRQQRHRRAR